MKVLFDTNVILDVLLNREPHAKDSAHALSLADDGTVTGLIGATTVTTIHYIVSKSKGEQTARKAISQLLDFLDIAPVNRQTIQGAVLSPIVDFEDAVLHEAASLVGANGIVTRDQTGFRNGTVPHFMPAEFVKAVNTLI